MDSSTDERAREIQDLINEATRIPRAPSRYKCTTDSTFESSRLPPLSLPKTEKYFGESSRLRFYTTYRELKEERYRFRQDDELDSSIGEYQRNLDKELDELSVDCPWSRIGYQEDLGTQGTLSEIGTEDGDTTEFNTARTTDDGDDFVEGQR